MTVDVEDSIRAYQGKTLVSLVAERLERKVVAGDLAAGARLNEVALAQEFGVSRGPVRESIRILERKGLVTVVANRGAFVRRIDVDDMIDLYRVRAAITGLASELAAERADATAVARLRELVESMAVAANAEDGDGYYELNLAFHALLVEVSGSPRVRILNEDLVTQAHLFRRGSLTRVTEMQQSNDEHRRIVEAIAACDPESARNLGRNHVNAGRERFIHAADSQQGANPGRVSARRTTQGEEQ